MTFRFMLSSFRVLGSNFILATLRCFHKTAGVILINGFRNKPGMARFVFLFLALFTSTLFPLTSPLAQTRIKIVYPFDHNKGLHSLSFCPPERRMKTKDLCCDAPLSISRVGTGEGCCRPEPIDAFRWNQTDTDPCGEFCTSPSLILSEGASSSCCTECHGKRSYSSEGRVCGTCCYPYLDCGQAVYSCSIGNGSAACSVPDTCSNPGSWWSSSDYQKYSCVSSANPCPGVGSWNAATNSWHCECSGTQLPVSFSDTYSCCSSCNAVRLNQTADNICGICSACNGTGQYISNSSCLQKNKPHPYCTWNNRSWRCSSCYRNGTFHHSGACGYNGKGANDACTSQIIFSSQSCVKSTGAGQVACMDWRHTGTTDGYTYCASYSLIGATCLSYSTVFPSSLTVCTQSRKVQTCAVERCETHTDWFCYCEYYVTIDQCTASFTMNGYSCSTRYSNY